MMGIPNIVALVASFVIFGLLQQVSASGVFELQLTSFDANGMRCCTASVPTDPECILQRSTTDCMARFRICLKHYQARIDNSSPCIFGTFLTPPVDLAGGGGGGEGGILEEPIQFRFDFAWPGTYSLIVEALKDTNGTAVESDTNQTLLARLTKQGHLEVGAAWSRVEAHSNGEGSLPGGKALPGGRARLRFGARVTCDAHYYGPGCANLCRPRDDRFGHYTCSAAGDRVCLPGWEGDYCTTPRCLPGCHGEHGHCYKPNECLCHSGWKGPLCDQCQRYPGCLHGGCQEPWNCICDEGWGGLFCNQDLNYCTNHRPCQFGGTCFNTGQGSYTCSCPPGFGGNDCEKRVDPPPPAAPSTTASTPPCGGGPGSGHLHPCLNGATCRANGSTSYVCECAEGWRGVHCETPETRTCADSPCRHGATCLDRDLSSPSPSTGGQGRGRDVILRGYICKCPPGYGGDHCERRMDPCAERPCLNGGSCRSRANGTGVVFDCLCAAGFSGRLCDVGGSPTPPRLPCDADAAAACLNGATCVVDNSRRGFHCACVPGYAGTSCESPVDYCAAARPCANGGRCHNLLNDYKCTCRLGFVGRDCSIRRPPELPENGRWATGNVSRHVAENGEENVVVGVAAADLGSSSQLGAEDAPLSTGHVVVIATLSTAVPAAALAAAAVVALAKRRRKRERRRADEEARMQNERNAGVFGAEKRQKQHPPGTPPPPATGGSLLRDAHMIRNTWGFPEDGSTKNRHKCVNSVIVVEEVAPPPADVSANASVVSSVSDLCYALQRAAAVAQQQQQQSAGHKQLNTEAAHRAALSQGLGGGGSVVGGSCGGKLVEKDFDNLRRASMVSGCIDKRVSVLSVDSLVSPAGICNTSDSSMTKRSLEKEASCTSPSGGPVFVIGEHLQEEGGGVVGSGMLATEV